MKFFSKLLLGAAFTAAATTASAQADLFMTAADDASIIVKREISGSDTTWSATSSTPDLMEVTLLGCQFSFGTTYRCNFDYLLKTDNSNVPFNQYPEISNFTPYGYAQISSPVPAIDVEGIWSSTPIHVAVSLSEPATDINSLNTYIPINSSDANAAAFVKPEQEGVAHKESAGWFNFKDIAGAPVVYQKFLLLGSGINQGLPLYKDGQALGPNYFEATSNKGVASVDNNNGAVLAWLTDRWNQTGGHYTELRLYTNGTSRHDQGLDLNDYNTLTLRMQCTNTMNIELFLGTGEDSSQNFLGDINCDTYTNDFTFDISGFNNLQDIQTALWFHIPTWKNPGLNEYRLFINVHESILTK